MKNTSNKPPGDFDLFRLSKSKAAVDLSPNTIRKLFEEGLNYYKSGRAIFVSKTELHQFLTRKALTRKAA